MPQVPESYFQGDSGADLYIDPTGLLPTEYTVANGIEPNSIGSDEAVSDVTVSQMAILPDGIASAEAVGSPELSQPLDVTVYPTTIGSGEVFEEPVVQLMTFYADEIESEEDVSDISMTTKSYVDSVDSAESVSDIEISVEPVIFPYQFESGSYVEPPQINSTVHIDSISSSEAHGSVRVDFPLYASVDSISSAESVQNATLNYHARCVVDGIATAEVVEDVTLSYTVNISSIVSREDVPGHSVSYHCAVDGISSEGAVPDATLNYVEYVTELTIDDNSSVEDVTLGLDAVIRGDSILSKEFVSSIEIGYNTVISPDEIDTSERISRVYFHHPMSDISIGDGSSVSDLEATVHVPYAYPLSILSDEQFNNVLAHQTNEIAAFALSSEAEFGFPAFQNNGRVDSPSIHDGEQIGDPTLSLTMTQISADSVASEEDVAEAFAFAASVAPKSFDVVSADHIQSVIERYGEEAIDKQALRKYVSGSWEWDLSGSIYYSTFTRVDSYTRYWIEESENENHEIVKTPKSEEVSYLKNIFTNFSPEPFSALVEAHQWEWYEYYRNYYGLLEEWVMNGSNTIAIEASADSGEVVFSRKGSWHVGFPIAEITPRQEFDGEFFPVATNLGIVDDRIAELRATSPAGIITTNTPQQVYATISAETAEVSDVLTSTCEYVIQDQVANYELYEGVSVSPAINYIFDVPEPSYINGVPVVPSLRTDKLCSVDIVSRALHIGADAYGKLNFFGVAPDIVGETVTDTDYNFELPPTLYKPLKPPYVSPEDPTSETEQEDVEQPDLPDGWDGWEPEDPADDGTDDGTDDGWEEDPSEGVTPTNGAMYKDFPLNLFGGGTVIMSGIPKYKNNGKKKWLFATAKKKKKKSNDEVCVDEQVDDGPKYIGMYIKNGKLVLTDGEFVLRTAAPPRGQRVLVFAGYYGSRSFVGWWMNPKRYKYRYGELVERANKKDGVTLIMIGRGWGVKKPGESQGNGFTIGSIKIVDESDQVGSFGYGEQSPPSGVINELPNSAGQTDLPTKELEALAAELKLAYSKYSESTAEFFVLDPNEPHDPVLFQMYEDIRAAMLSYYEIDLKVHQYPNMPPEELAKAHQAMSELDQYIRDMRQAAEAQKAGAGDPKWVPVSSIPSDELVQYKKDYERWKVQPRMIGYFSIDDSSRVGVPGVR